MKRMILFSLMALMTIAAFGRKHVENATVVADTIFYAENMSNVTSADQASYYRLLMTTGSGLNKKDVFQDFYMNGNLRAEGGYSFIDLGNDRVLLETMSGKGTEMGRNFEELRQILDLVEKKNKMGICLDTCHVWDGGYDIVNDLDGVLEEFDRIIGLEKLKAIHLNDSLNDLGSHKDRHARIGEGRIGLEALVRVIRHPRLEGIPFILETPNDDEGWSAEIRNLREAYEK